MVYSFLEQAEGEKFRAEGATIEEMFVSAADALNYVIRGDIEILEQEERGFEVEGDVKDVPDCVVEDSDILSIEDKCSKYVSYLYSFLGDILVLLDNEDFLVAKVKSVEIGGGKLKCVVVGDKGENYKFTNDVKEVTYSDMYVKETEKGFECQVVLDV